ncbi:hypothetical protein JCM10212_003983 [Sporobolomyces blumeae]
MSTSSPALPSPPAPPKLVNLYHLRLVGSPKPCFICSKETTACLANDGPTDWIYVCKSHTLDPGFARPAPTQAGSASSATTSPALPSSTAASTAAAPSPPTVPQSEIDKVKKEYEEKQKRKAAATSTDSSSTTTTTTTTAGKALSVLKTSASAISTLASTTQSTLFPPPAPVVPSPSELLRAEASRSKTFVLNRDYFRMRQDLKRREWEKHDAKTRGAEWEFPKVPKGGLPSVPTTKIG